MQKIAARNIPSKERSQNETRPLIILHLALAGSKTKYEIVANRGAPDLLRGKHNTITCVSLKISRSASSQREELVYFQRWTLSYIGLGTEDDTLNGTESNA